MTHTNQVVLHCLVGWVVATSLKVQEKLLLFILCVKTYSCGFQDNMGGIRQFPDLTVFFFLMASL